MILISKEVLDLIREWYPFDTQGKYEYNFRLPSLPDQNKLDIIANNSTDFEITDVSKYAYGVSNDKPIRMNEEYLLGFTLKGK